MKTSELKGAALDWAVASIENLPIDTYWGAPVTMCPRCGEKDPLYDQAVEIVLKNRKASISLVQRHLKIGYNRAARLVEDMEKAGLVSSMSTSGQREILVPAAHRSGYE